MTRSHTHSWASKRDGDEPMRPCCASVCARVSCAFAVCEVSEEKECCRNQFSLVCDMYMMIFVFFSFLSFFWSFVSRISLSLALPLFHCVIFLTEGIHNNQMLFAHVSARYCGCRRYVVWAAFSTLLDDALDTVVVVVAAAAVFLLGFSLCIHFDGELVLLAFWMNRWIGLRNAKSMRSHDVLLAAAHIIQFGQHVEKEKDTKRDKLFVNESNVWHGRTMHWFGNICVVGNTQP